LPLQPDVTVDSGTDEKEKVEMGSVPVSYPVTTWSKSGSYRDVVIEFSQDCAGLASCQAADVDFSGVLPVGVIADASVEGEIVLTGDYAAINQAMLSLVIASGSGNPYPINVKITATDKDGVTSDFDSFIIPIFSVSSTNETI
jgi:hypothetical protein